MGDKCKASRVLDCRSVTLSAFCTGWMTVSLYICFACKQKGGNVLGGWQMGRRDSAMSNGDISHLLLRHYSLLVYEVPYGHSIWGEQCDALQGLCWAGCFQIVFCNTKALSSYALSVHKWTRGTDLSFYCWYRVSQCTKYINTVINCCLFFFIVVVYRLPLYHRDSLTIPKVLKWLKVRSCSVYVDRWVRSGSEIIHVNK